MEPSSKGGGSFFAADDADHADEFLFPDRSRTASVAT
jgi:hypothetical protein